MSFSPRLIAFLLAIIITALTLIFLSFLPTITPTILFIVGVSTFFPCFFLVYYAIDILIFREINRLYETIKLLKIKDFAVRRKSLIKNANPLKKLNAEVSAFVVKKQRENEELKKMEVFRREFLANVSHELKTPIFSAQGFIHTLIDGAKNEPETLDRFLEKTAKSLDTLTNLVHDLLALSQVETGDIKMNLQKFDLLKLTTLIFEQLETTAKERNVTLKTKPTLLNHCYVIADKQQMEQVMTNLIENGIKYGKTNGNVSVVLKEEKKHFLVLVEDNGYGIELEHLPRIFERFYRIDKSRSKEMGGTGLGLAIVKHILQAHQSKINVQSTIGQGTTFSFKIQKYLPIPQDSN